MEGSVLLVYVMTKVPRGGAEKGLWTFGGFRDDGLLRLPRENTSSLLTSTPH